ncbi:MAG: hypothetical protein ACR2GO_01495 [Candidatus Limnocylindria bacterium]
MRPDPGRAAQDAVLASMTSLERTTRMAELRRNGRWSLWRQVEAAGITDPVAAAEYILRRLYPEESEAWFTTVIAQLRAAHASGAWSGFERPLE